MKKHAKTLTALLLIFVTLLSACGTFGSSTTAPPADGPLHLTVRAGEPQTTADPGKATADGSDTLLYHLYENLMRWEDDGSGYAVLAPGQAKSYTVELDYAGNATYTFTMRDDIRWSDGEAVTAHHFAAAWKRLADPANELPHRELLSILQGYDDVQESRDTDLLGVSAPDAATLVVTLIGNPPHFLETLCAGAYTMPIRHNPPNPKKIITNGPYTVEDLSGEGVTLTRSETYYDKASVTVESIRLLPAADSQTDYDALLAGEADLVENLPAAVLQTLSDSGNWTSEPVTSTLAVAFNTLSAPLDSPEIRTALQLVIDRQAVVDALTDHTFRAATGVIPYGVSDFSTRETEEEIQTTEETLPDPNAPMPEVTEAPAVYWDFRTHSEEIVTVDTTTEYAADCRYAQTLLAAAGYRDGEGFPVLDYIFLNTEENVTIAKALRSMWKEQLGIDVALRAMTQEDYDAMLVPVADEETGLAAAPFQIAAFELSAKYNDAEAFLAQWSSADPGNFTGYSSPAFDILIDAADAAVSPDAYDAYLHDAEAILLTDAPLLPLCYRGGSCLLASGLEGLYRAPNGIYFLSRVTRSF